MAKATKTTATAPAGGENKAGKTSEAKARAFRSGKNDKFIPVYEGGKPKEPTGKLAPQAKTILNAIIAGGREGITREKLVANLGNGVLVTKQPVARILSYYVQDLKDSGAVKVEEAAPEAKPEAAAK